MNILYKLYFALPDDNKFGICGKAVNRLIAKILKVSFDIYFPNYYKKMEKVRGYGINRDQVRARKYICSLTSFPGRIHDVWLCVESLMRQTVKPDEIILWLAESQFPGKKLPLSVTNLIPWGLTIRWCNEDLRSHKKYFYVFQEYSSDAVILFDDDFYYPNNVLENLIQMEQRNPCCICATRVHKMTYSDQKLDSYSNWIHNYNPQKNETMNLFFTSGAGTLFPPKMMPLEMFNKRVFEKICFSADDVWLNFMAVSNHVRVVSNAVFNKDAITVSKTQKEKLVTGNVFNGGNDAQIKAVLAYLNLQLSE